MRKYAKSKLGGMGIKTKAFTLIELLAVIVILAIIALISIPIILNIIEKTRKSAFKDTAYGIMESAKVKFTEAILDGITEPTNFEYPFDDLEFNGTKPNGGIVNINKNGIISLALHNNKWCAIKQVDDSEVRIIDYDKHTCKIGDVEIPDTPIDPNAPTITEGSSVNNIKAGSDSAIPGSYFNINNGVGTITCVDLANETAVSNTKDLSEGNHEIECRMIDNENTVTSLKRIFKIISNKMTGSELVENNSDIRTLDPNKNPRFVGADPSNYVNFGNDLYRIIGVFDGQMKIIYWGTKDNPGNFYGDSRLSFDANSAGGGHNYNDWSQSTLQKTLNTTYWNTIPAVYQAMVDQDHVWNIGGTPNYETATRGRFYNIERGTTISSIMESATWEGKVGLIYPSDYGYASKYGSASCNNKAMYLWNTNGGDAPSACGSPEYDWLGNTVYHQWTMTPITDETSKVIYILCNSSEGYVDEATASYTKGAHPVLYLEANVKVSGKGTLEEPFELSL